jgi:hypothetical protein
MFSPLSIVLRDLVHRALVRDRLSVLPDRGVETLNQHEIVSVNREPVRKVMKVPEIVGPTVEQSRSVAHEGLERR